MKKPALPARTLVSPLADLNAHLTEVSTAARAGLDAGAGPWPDLRSTVRFRETWDRLSAEVQVRQSLQRAPRNAGPLNPQRLMSETLAQIGGLSPHYLRRFLAHTETLLWLEQAQAGLRPAGKTAKGSASAAVPDQGRRRRR